MSKDQKELDEQEFADHEEEQKPEDELTIAKSDLAKMTEEAAKWKNEYYKAYADLDNLRKSLQKDHQEALKYRAEGFLDELIPVLDNFYIALQGNVSSEEAKNYRIGFSYIYNQLVNALTSEGVKEAEVKLGDEFDANYMHAIDTLETEEEPNKVVKINQKGYYLKDRLIRPAMVTVSKKKEEKKEETSKEEPSENEKKEENSEHLA